MNSNGSTSRGGLSATYRQLPRAMKWLVWLVIGLALYFILIEPLLVLMAEQRNRADQAVMNIDRYSEPDEANRDIIADGHKKWGNVLPPGADQSRVLEAKVAISEVLSKYDLTKDRASMTERSSTKLKTDAAKSGVEYVRGPIEVKFTAKPHIAMAVIGDLEMVPSIAQVASVRVRRLTDRAEVEVTLVADAWYRSKE